MDSTVISNEGRVGKKEKSGKKKIKEEEFKDAVLLTKRKRKEEKKDRKELEMRNKKKKENVEKEKTDLADDNEEMGVNEANDQEKNKQKEEKKKKKKEKKMKENVEKEKTYLVDDNEEMGVNEANDQEKNREEEEKKKKEKKMKENVEKEKTDVVDDNEEMGVNEANDQEKNKEKEEKKKKKKEKTDLVDDNEEMVVNEANDQEKNKEKEEEKKKKKKKEKEIKEKTDLVDDNEEMGVNEANDQEKNKEKKKKDKKTKDDIIAVSEEQRKIAKEKKKSTKKMVIDGGKANCENQTEKAKKSKKDSVTSPNPVKPNSKKVTFSDKLKVYPPTEDVAASSPQKDSDGYVRGKRFTEEEDKMIQQAVYDYIDEHNLGEKGLEMVLNCTKHNIRDCWKEIAKALPHRPHGSIYLRAHTLFERDATRGWSQEEVDQVLQYYAKHGPRWSAMAKEMGKFRHHVKEVWRRNRLPNQNSGHWSQEEYQGLFDLVNKDLQMKVLEEKRKRHNMLRDNIGWEAISTKLGTRATALCCRKWYYQLTSPMVAEGVWDDADDYRLLMSLVEVDASCEEEVDWEKLLEHRSGDVCRQRWNQMWNHLGEHGNKTWAEQVDVLSKRYCPDLLEVREEVTKQRDW